MSLITKKNIEELIKVKNEYCISIIIPTEVAGENAESKIMLKNQLAIIEKQLEDNGRKPKEISELISPVKELLENSELWRNLSDALFIYRNENLFSTFSLPVDTEEFSLVSDRFYIVPLLSALNEDGRFFLLMISMNQNQLFECDQNDFEEVATGDIIPDSILDSVGRDVEQKSLQFRSGQTGRGTGMYHGKGEGKDDKKKELTKYLQQLDKGLNTLLEGYNLPLVVSSVDYVFSIFKDISSYENVYPENVSGNVDDDNIKDIHERACEVLMPYFNKVRNEKIEVYREADQKATSDLEKIIAASDAGQVESLFVKKNVRVWGVYDRKNMKTTLHKERMNLDHCMLDLSARNTILHGGRVYNLKAESMPEPGEKANAILRYL